MLSYSDRGFLPVSLLAEMISSRFRRIEVFFDRIRHHSQGVPLSIPEGKVTEYVLIGTP